MVVVQEENTTVVTQKQTSIVVDGVGVQGASGGGVWGGIIGNLADQTDLQAELDSKVNNTGTETISGVKTFADHVALAAAKYITFGTHFRSGSSGILDMLTVDLTVRDNNTVKYRFGRNTGIFTCQGQGNFNAGLTSTIALVGKGSSSNWIFRGDTNGSNYSGFYFGTTEGGELILRDSAGVIKAHIKSDGDSIISGNLQSGGYKSSDGSIGYTGSFTAQSGETITVKNGLITDIT